MGWRALFVLGAAFSSGAAYACGEVAPDESPPVISYPPDAAASDVEAAAPIPDRLVDAGDAEADGPIPSPADGVCSPRISGSVLLDPDCVYVVASALEVGAPEVLFSPSYPNERLYGFGSTQSMVIRPSDGALFFSASDGNALRAYRFTKSAPGAAYPPAQLAQQTLLGTPACGTYLEGLSVTLDTSAVLYGCYLDFGRYHVGSANPFPTFGREVMQLLTGGAFVAYTPASPPPAMIVRNDGGTTLVPLPPDVDDVKGVVGFKTTPSGGFLEALLIGTDAFRIDEIHPDGTRTMGTPMGRGPLPPVFFSPPCAIDAKRDLYCRLVLTQSPRAYGLIRLTTSASPEVVFDERLSDVKLGTPFRLVTGP